MTPETSPQPVRVLLVEDDDEAAQEFGRLVREAPGFPEKLQVERARSATEARALVARDAPDAIIVKDCLGSEDGIELIRELRSAGLAVPALLLTAQREEEIAVRALEAGAADCLARPQLTPDAVARALRHALALASAVRLRRRAEEALRVRDLQLDEARRLEALATLAGGLAHEFNNRLNVITGHAELALRRLPGDAPAQHHLKRVLEAAAELAELTQRVQVFSGNQVVEASILDLNDLVSGWLGADPRPAGQRVDVAVRYTSETVRVKVNAQRFRQILSALARYAGDTMPEGGSLQVETASAGLDTASGVALPKGEYACLSVSDNGPGLASEVRARIFDPLFTTAGRPAASSLGLSAAYGIVKQSGGEIWAYSEPGRGSCFKIYLPRVDERGGLWTGPLAPAPEAGSETLLLVEDDQVFREALADTLAASGFRVLDAGHATEALRLVEGHTGPIHAVISDVMLPGMDGPALVALLRGLRPEMRALLMSGFPERARAKPLPATLIEKPFSSETLLRRLREVLDAAR